jgi:hypothetical protein
MRAYLCDVCNRYFKDRPKTVFEYAPFAKERNATWERRNTKLAVSITMTLSEEDADICETCRQEALKKVMKSMPSIE